MYGWIHECLRQLVLEKFGVESWEAITKLAGEKNIAYNRYVRYEDDSVLKLVAAASKHLGTSQEILLEAFGEHFIKFTRTEGYGNLLQCLGSTLAEWLSNVDMLHSHISSSLPEMVTPHFKCQISEEDPDVLFFYYKSQRGAGLEPIVVGILKEVASFYFHSQMNFELIQTQDAVRSIVYTCWRIQVTKFGADPSEVDSPNMISPPVDFRGVVDTVPKGCPFDHSSNTSSQQSSQCPSPRSMAVATTTGEAARSGEYPLGFGLSPSVLKELYPHHVVFGNDFKILQCGPAITTLLKRSVIQKSLWDCFDIDSTDKLSGETHNWSLFISCVEKRQVFFTSKFSGPKLCLKGPIYFENRSSVAFALCTPTVDSLNSMAKKGFKDNILKAPLEMERLMLSMQLSSEMASGHRKSLELDAERELRMQAMAKATAAAESALATKKMFVRYVSHEIRTPLTICKVGLDLITEDIIDLHGSEETLSMAEDCRNSMDVAVSILNDLLSYEKLEGGVMEMYRSFTPAVDFVRKTVSSFNVTSKHKEILLEFTNDIDVNQLAADSWTAVVDSESLFLDVDVPKMSQVIRNLVSNALKFTDRGGHVSVHLSVDDNTEELTPRESDAVDNNPGKNKVETKDFMRCGSLIVRVIDNGAGIKTDDQSKVFNEIVQFTPNELQAGGGSGLGLWISKRICDAHFCKINMHSEGLGKGSTFTVQMPVYRRAFSPPGTATSAHVLNEVSAPEANLKIALRELDILIVDDSALILKFVSKILHSKGSICTTAENGQIAIDLISKRCAQGNGEFDIVLMDYIMPELDGPAATQKLRKKGYSGKIIGVTGNAMPSDIAIFLDAGADHVMAKPLDLDDLALYIHECHLAKKPHEAWSTDPKKN